MRTYYRPLHGHEEESIGEFETQWHADEAIAQDIARRTCIAIRYVHEIQCRLGRYRVVKPG